MDARPEQPVDAVEWQIAELACSRALRRNGGADENVCFSVFTRTALEESDMRLMHVIRWALVPVSALVAWGAALVIGAILHDAVNRLCPESYMVSGACVAPWTPFADAVVLIISAAIAAALIVLSTSYTAPSHRGRVAAVVYALGAVWAVVMAIAGAAYLALPAAGFAGAWAMWLVRRRPSGLFRRRSGQQR